MTSAKAIMSSFLIAVSILPTYAQDDVIRTEDDKQKPIQVRCPAKNNGALVLDSRTKSGTLGRLTVYYTGDAATSMTYHKTDNSGKWQMLASIDYSVKNTPEDVVTGNKGLKLSEAIRVKYCNGNQATRRRFDDFLQRNRRATSD